MIWFFVYAVVGFGSVVFELLRTGHAKKRAKGDSQDAGCWDERVWKLVPVLGGAASFSFGWPYFVLAQIPNAPSWFLDLALVYGLLQFILSSGQTLALLIGTVRTAKKGGLKKNFPALKAHWGNKFGRRGCGSSTGRSPLWPLYWITVSISADSWLGKIVGVIRDGITFADFISSLPVIMVIDVVSFAVSKTIWIPKITDVDQA